MILKDKALKMIIFELPLTLDRYNIKRNASINTGPTVVGLATGCKEVIKYNI